MDLEDVIKEIIQILESGINIVGFVSPGHYIPQLKIIINALKIEGYDPTIVYNSNGYDDADQLRSLEGIVDVFLPDFKYMENDIAGQYSDANDYPEIAIYALKEMYRQVGSSLITNNDGYAMRGMLIRHLVLPGHTENSIKVLETIADELSPNISVALMSQYYPSYKATEYDSLNDHVHPNEYGVVVQRMNELGIRGFVQGIESSGHYRPDFEKDSPFE